MPGHPGSPGAPGTEGKQGPAGIPGLPGKAVSTKLRHGRNAANGNHMYYDNRVQSTSHGPRKPLKTFSNQIQAQCLTRFHCNG